MAQWTLYVQNPILALDRITFTIFKYRPFTSLNTKHMNNWCVRYSDIQCILKCSPSFLCFFIFFVFNLIFGYLLLFTCLFPFVWQSCFDIFIFLHFSLKKIWVSWICVNVVSLFCQFGSIFLTNFSSSKFFAHFFKISNS